MSRPLRFIPDSPTLVEVTTRTIHGRFLLRPSPLMNEAILGVLGRAQDLYSMKICAAIFLANHYHLLLIVDSAEQLRDFMTYFNSNLAKEAGRLAGWREKFWARRYRAITVSNEPAAQRERLRYILSHGVKEGLVGHPAEWPGVHCVKALLEGAPLSGYWFDRTREYAVRRQGKEYDRLQFATLYTVQLSPLPCWADLPEEIQRKRVAELIQEVEEDAAIRQKQTGIPPLGRETIAQQPYNDQPTRTKKSPGPLVHAATKRVRDELISAYYAFVGAFRDAAEKWRAGDRSVIFPSGCFPPALPFVSG